MAQDDSLGVTRRPARVADRGRLVRSRRSDLNLSLEPLFGAPDFKVGQLPQLDPGRLCPRPQDGSFALHERVHADNHAQARAFGRDLEQGRDMARRGKDDTQGRVIDDVLDDVGSERVVKGDPDEGERMSGEIDQLPFRPVHAPDPDPVSRSFIDQLGSTGGT